jgi:hypothetical protein
MTAKPDELLMRANGVEKTQTVARSPESALNAVRPTWHGQTTPEASDHRSIVHLSAPELSREAVNGQTYTAQDIL